MLLLLALSLAGVYSGSVFATQPKESGQVCADQFLTKKLVAWVGEISPVPAFMDSLGAVEVRALGRGHGGDVYYVKLKDGRETVLKKYRDPQQAEMDFQALKKIKEKQALSKTPVSFEVPTALKRTDLGDDVVELEYVRGQTVQQVIRSADKATAAKVTAAYNAKLNKMKTFLESNFKTTLSISKNPMGELSLIGTIPTSSGSADRILIWIKSDNVLIEESSGKIFLIDPY